MSSEPSVAIVGAGLAGLVLALALEKHCGIKAQVYEQAPQFDSNAGGAIGLYPNGLRVIRDISPELLQEIRLVGYPYIYRRWMRHDGTEVACAEESVLCETKSLQSIGIRRWRLQKVLCDWTAARGIPIHFGKRLRKLLKRDDREVLEFEDDSVHYADIVFGADGVKSKVRESVFGQTEVDYTGITCLMGAADIARPFRGICFPSSSTTKCHACYYPTGEGEQVFQIFFPTEERPETWGNLSPEEAQKECLELADKLEKDGWHMDFLMALRNAKSVIRVGLRAREPLSKWVSGRTVLLGDAAHPPVPYIGQGAMMAFEDAGILSLLMKQLCLKDGKFSLDNFDKCMQLYEAMRVPRTTQVLGASKTLGAMQQNRAESWFYNLTKEWGIWLQVQYYGTLPIMFQGAKYDYNLAVRDRLTSKL